METANNISKIGVISDTHIPSRAKSLPNAVFTLFKNVNMIIHCGDIVSPDVITELSAIAPVFGVKGNMDTHEISFPYDRIIKINDKYIFCISHGSGSPFGLKSRLYKKFLSYNPDIIIYGHSHRPDNEKYNSVLFFNPGSAVMGAENNTVGMISLSELNLKGEILEV